MIDTDSLFGFRIVESDLLPYPPSPGEWARRYVRHAMSDVVKWLNEPLGPHPDEQTHVILMGNTALTSATIVSRMKELD